MTGVRGMLVAAGVGLSLGLGVLVAPVSAACPPDSVASGTVCMDKYEASVWYVPPTLPALIKRIQNGTVTLALLISPSAVAAGVVQVGLPVGPGPAPSDWELAGCPPTADGCLNVYAVSIAGVRPSTNATWPQAAAAARNSLKRLPTNQEWQVAALGTPEGPPLGLCPNYAAADLVLTGTRPQCVSDVGAFDMVGNVFEWVAEWVPGRTGCGPTPLFSSEGLNGPNCLAAVDSANPLTAAAIVRSGSGVFDVNGQRLPSTREDTLGFRAAR